MAQALFDEAQRLMKANRAAEACPKFAASQKLEPAVGTLLNLAVCYEQNGQTASAWATFKDAASASKISGEAKREAFARQRAQALEPDLARLAIAVAPEAAKIAGLEVKRDGVAVPELGWGVPFPVDPGDHVIEASAPQHRAWSAHVKVAPKEASARAEVPVLEAIPVPPPVATPSTSSTSTATTPSPPALHDVPPAEPSSTRRTWGLVLGGVGVAALGAGGVLGLVAKGQYNKTDGQCTGDVCTPDGIKHRDDAFGTARIATIVFIGGAALVGTGVVLFVTAPRGQAPSAAITIAPTLARGGGGLSLEAPW